MPKYLVGVRPSGRLHLGHYASVIKPAIEYDASVLIAELHAPDGDAIELYDQLVKYVDRHNIKFQRETFHSFTYFRLLEHTPVGLLNHMPQYKAKEKNALMFTYPVLMAADLVGYDYVIVGEDQRAHIEFARDILPKLNIKCPEPLYDGGKIMDLRHPDRKMSKSDPSSCLFLDDEDYKRKITKAVTDEAGMKNLRKIFYLLEDEGRDITDDISASDLKNHIIELYERNFC